MERSLFWSIIDFFFKNGLSEIVYNKSINYSRHDFKPFSVGDMSFKFDTKLHDSVDSVKQVKLLRMHAGVDHASHTRMTFQPLCTEILRGV